MDSHRTKLEVVMFLSSLGLIRGGLESWAAFLMGGLVERGHDVTIVAGWWPYRPLGPDLSAMRVRWLRVPTVPVSFPLWNRLIVQRKPGLPLKVQSLTFYYACRSYPAVQELVTTCDVSLTVLEIESVKFSAWRQQHNHPNISCYPGGIEWEWLRKDRSVRRLAISRTIASHAQQLPNFHVHGVVPPGITDQWLDVAYRVRPKARTILFVGRLESNKGIKELLDIFESVSLQVPELELRLVGDGLLRSWIESEMSHRNIVGQVNCLGVLPPEQVRLELQNADLFLFPTHYESFGIAILEAMAVGVPVICTDLPALREVTAGAACLLTLDDLSRWSSMIQELLADQPARERLSCAGRSRAQKFTLSRTSADLEWHLLQALERGSPELEGQHGDAV
ncbi:MAG: glycosyltransferase family 4 protein [Chloroflexota bacterium]|nr:glycosyltransferase family 4 protein [Chloroflexota bacterium]